MSLPAFRSRSVFAWWHIQQRGLRLPVDAGPYAVWGSTWSFSFPKRLPQSTQLIPSKSGGGPSCRAILTSTGVLRVQRRKWRRSTPS